MVSLSLMCRHGLLIVIRPINTVPGEIILEIFDRLTAVDSACLGLTCKKFYAVHRARFGAVPLV